MNYESLAYIFYIDKLYIEFNLKHPKMLGRSVTVNVYVCVCMFDFLLSVVERSVLLAVICPENFWLMSCGFTDKSSG